MPSARRAPRSAAQPPFESIYRHGYARVAVATPRVEVASPAFNVAQTLELAREAAAAHCVFVLFPELGLSAYSNEDLFQQDALLDASLTALEQLVDASRILPIAMAVGLPLRVDGRLFNCGVVVHRGRLLGAVPKTYIPNYREFYEKRHFASGNQALATSIRLLGQDVPFGSQLLFEAINLDGFVLHLEICEDLWVPLPPSTLGALAGATVIANLSASDITVGKADYRRLISAAQSAKCVAAYLYSAAGPGESTTDLAWDGHALAYENGERLAESKRFPQEPGFITADIDLDHLRQERMRLTSFGDSVQAHADLLYGFRRIPFEADVPAGRVPLRRRIERFPYVPADPARRDERCSEVYDIQVEGLMKRLTAARLEKVVIGISGGLDSTQAALVAVRAFDRLKLPRANILGYTLPGFATSRYTFDNAHALMKALGISANEIDIRPSAELMLKNIGHPSAKGKDVYDITYENVQAGERTSHLFRLANMQGALVLGTGDLSELALGFTTYGVGDHMSHYNVNGSVPKTLIQHLIRWLVSSHSSSMPGRAPCSSASSARRSRPNWSRVRATSRSIPPRPWWARTNCRTSTCTTSADSATGRARSHSFHIRRGAIAVPAYGRTPCRRRSGVSTISPPSRAGSRCSCSGSSRAASSSARRCRTGRRSARADRFRRAATGARRATRRRPCGSKSCTRTCRSRSRRERGSRNPHPACGRPLPQAGEVTMPSPASGRGD